MMMNQRRADGELPFQSWNGDGDSTGGQGSACSSCRPHTLVGGEENRGLALGDDPQDEPERGQS